MTKQYRKTPRANWIDYENGIFFITICTKNRIHYFGTITDGIMFLSDIGKIVENHLNNASKYMKIIEIPLYVIMPNHIHLIVCVNINPDDGNDVNPISQRNPNPALRSNPTCHRHVPTLSKYINSFKGAVCKDVRKIHSDFAWQPRYHDHLIRNDREATMISDYIINNVAKWDEDCFFEDCECDVT